MGPLISIPFKYSYMSKKMRDMAIKMMRAIGDFARILIRSESEIINKTLTRANGEFLYLTRV